MRLFRHSWQILTFAALMAGLGAGTWLWASQQPQPPPVPYSDPVEGLRQALKNNNDPGSIPSLQAREKSLQEAAAKLVSPSDLRQALGLLEWEDENTEFAKRAAIDLEARTSIGQRLEEIVKDVVAKGGSTSKLAVASMMGEMGTTVRALNFKEKRGLARTWAPYLETLTKSEDPMVRQTAARALAKIDPEPKAAVKALKDLVDSPLLEDRQAAAEAMSELMRNVLDVQKKGRGTTEIIVAEKDVMACADEVVPANAPNLVDKDASVRRHGVQTITNTAAALAAFAKIPAKPEDLPPPLAPGENWSPKQLASVQELHLSLDNDAKLFGTVPDALKSQGESLARLLDDPDVQVRYLSRKALEELANARNRLKRRIDSVPALPGQSPPSKTYTDPLKAAIEPGVLKIATEARDPDGKVRMASVQFLEAIDEAAVPAIDAIIEALKDKDKFIRWSAARTLGKIGPDHHPEKTVPALAALMNPQEDHNVREETASALRQFGAAAKPALPQLIKLLNIGEAEAQEAVIKAITAIGGSETTSAIPALIKSLDSRNVTVRKLAAEALGRMGPRAKAAEPKLLEHLRDDDPTVRSAVSDALLNIDRPR